MCSGHVRDEGRVEPFVLEGQYHQHVGTLVRNREANYPNPIQLFSLIDIIDTITMVSLMPID